jgi:hypothetical protein
MGSIGIAGDPMRTSRARICIVAVTAISAIAASAHVGPGPIAADAGRGIERVAAAQKRSKSPCDAERPPSYCKPKKGAGKPTQGPG